MQKAEGTTDSGTIHRVNYNDKEILLIATAHVSKESQQEVKEIIEKERPDSVCIELDENRYKSITEKDKHSNMDIVQVIKQGKAMLVLVNLFLASFQRKMAAKMGIESGAEMIQGIESAKEIGAKLVLADRDIQTTFKRIWRLSSIGQKFKLLYQILGSLVVSEKDITEEDIEKMKTGDMLDNALSMMGETFPLIKKVLIDERDIYLATKIKNAPGKKIVAVLGAGHVPGIIKAITEDKYLVPKEINSEEFENKLVKKMDQENKEKMNKYYKKENDESTDYKLKEDISSKDEEEIVETIYATLPKKGKAGKIIGWAIPLAILAWIVSGFFYGRGLEHIVSYALGTGIGAAIGCVVALAHPLTILVGLVGAWLTVLHPVLGIGMFTGLAEAILKKPKVSDLENLNTDIQSFKGFFKNRFTHILIVIFLSSIATMLGTFIGVPLLERLFNF